ncbi:MAG: Sensor protein resE [Patescibacteria group bacterium]|nr:Sensor protein resE [Patescibacteria group bacterium]
MIVVTADALLGLVVWLQAPRRRLNRIFALLTASFMLWSATSFYDQTAAGPEKLSLLMANIPFVFAASISLFMVLFSLYFPENHPSSNITRTRVTWGLAFTTPPLLVMAFTNLLVSGTTSSPTLGNNIVPGPLLGVFSIYFLGWLGFALGNLFYKFRKARSSADRLQLNYVFLGFMLTTVIAFTTNVIVPVATRNPTLVRFGFLSTLFLIGFIGYTIAAHRLFNIRLLVARSVAYILLLSTLTAVYGTGIFAVSRLLFPDTAITTVESSLFVALAILIAITYQPLRRFFEKTTDRAFFRDHYDAQIVLDQTGSILASELLLKPLLSKALEQICRPMRLRNGQFLVLDHDKLYTRTHYGPLLKDDVTTELMQRLKQPLIVTDELQPGELKDALGRLGIRVSLVLKTHDELVGYLFLGDKLSGEIYSNQDLALLEILRKELAVAIANAKAYEEIARFNMTLQERIKQATARLSSANRNLKVLDKAKDDFISMASHQLGTPLTAITGYLSMSLDEDKDNMTIAQREYITFALEASERMVAMSGDLLNVSRLSSGRFTIQRQQVDLNHLAEQEVKLLQAAAKRKNLTLTFTPSPGLPQLDIDESKTRQVIMNYVDNAIYYTPSGSIHVEVKQENGWAVFTVTDTGMGVPEAEQAKLFAKFYRAENARASRPDGTGLGLYLAKRVIEEHGGAIIFASKAGKGSTFGFSLPLKANAP